MTPARHAALVCLTVGLLALALGLVLYVIIRRLKRRWAEGSRELSELRRQARGLQGIEPVLTAALRREQQR